MNQLVSFVVQMLLVTVMAEEACDWLSGLNCKVHFSADGGCCQTLNCHRGRGGRETTAKTGQREHRVPAVGYCRHVVLFSEEV